MVTTYQIAYLAMAVTGLLSFGAVLMWATERTNATPKMQTNGDAVFVYAEVTAVATVR